MTRFVLLILILGSCLFALSLADCKLVNVPGSECPANRNRPCTREANRPGCICYSNGTCANELVHTCASCYDPLVTSVSYKPCKCQ